MAYSEKVIDHYNDPRNVGSFMKNDDQVGTGLVRAPECGDVMKLQIKQAEKYGYTLSEWRSLTHEEQCKAAAINRARKAASQFEVPVEVWIELTYNQREKIRDRFKRGRRVPELLEDL